VVSPAFETIGLFTVINPVFVSVLVPHVSCTAKVTS